MHFFQQTGEAGQWVFIDEFKRDLSAAGSLRQALYLSDHRFSSQLSMKPLVHCHIAETTALQTQFDLFSLRLANRSWIINLRFGCSGSMGATDVLQNLARSDIKRRNPIFGEPVGIVPAHLPQIVMVPFFRGILSDDTF